MVMFDQPHDDDDDMRSGRARRARNYRDKYPPRVASPLWAAPRPRAGNNSTSGESDNTVSPRAVDKKSKHTEGGLFARLGPGQGTVAEDDTDEATEAR